MIQPRYDTLQSLFSNRVFRIPHYQRFYSWRSRQREDLFADLEKLADKKKDDSHHFMATIVCLRTKQTRAVGASEYGVFDIVDGQQRLTTLIMILKSIELSLGADNSAGIDLKKMLVKGDGNLVLLQTNNTNEHIFSAFLRDGQEPTRSGLVTDADVTLARGIRDCKQFVERWASDRGDVLALLRLVQNRLGFVIFDTEDSRAVYSIFEVLNSRGLAVDWLDKCKSVLMGRAFELASSERAKDAAISGLQKLWGLIYGEISKKSVPGDQVLRVAATLQFGPVRGKPVSADESLENFRDECKTPQKPSQISSSLYDVARKLVSLESNRPLEVVTEILQARILAVALLSAECMSDAERKRALDQWERVTFRIFGLLGKDARTKVGEYVRLAERINNRSEGAARYSEIMTALRKLGEDFPIDQAVEAGISGKNLYESPSVCRYVLWRYEEWLARAKGKHSTTDEHARQAIWNERADDSIEHIFPQNPEEGGAWEGKMRRGKGKVQPASEHVNRIGNLILLPQTLNEEAKRKGFQSKKTAYERHSLRMVSEVIAETDWDLSSIDERESKICDFARREWADVASD